MGLFSLAFLVDALVKASLVLAITAVLALSLRRSSASARHLLWTLGMIGALAAPALSVVTPRWTVPIVRVTTTAAVPAAAAIDATPNVIERGAPAFGRATQNTPHAAGSVESVAASGFSRRISWTALLLITWAIGAALILGRMLLGLVAVSWMSRRTLAVT